MVSLFVSKISHKLKTDYHKIRRIAGTMGHGRHQIFVAILIWNSIWIRIQAFSRIFLPFWSTAILRMKRATAENYLLQFACYMVYNRAALVECFYSNSFYWDTCAKYTVFIQYICRCLVPLPLIMSLWQRIRGDVLMTSTGVWSVGETATVPRLDRTSRLQAGN